jgi:hypothetical protein
MDLNKDDTARFSAQTGMLYLFDVSAGRPNPKSVKLDSPEGLAPFRDSSGSHCWAHGS